VVKMGLEWKKDVGGVAEWGMYVCFCMLTTKERFGVLHKITSIADAL
jgi:hypothetical protein